MDAEVIIAVVSLVGVVHSGGVRDDCESWSSVSGMGLEHGSSLILKSSKLPSPRLETG